MEPITINTREELIALLDKVGITKDYDADTRSWKLDEHDNIIVHPLSSPIFPEQKRFPFIGFENHPKNSNAPRSLKMSYDNVLKIMERFIGEPYSFRFDDDVSTLMVYRDCTIREKFLVEDPVGFVTISRVTTDLETGVHDLKLYYFPLEKSWKSGLKHRDILVEQTCQVVSVGEMMEWPKAVIVKTILSSGKVLTHHMMTFKFGELDAVKQKLLDEANKELADVLLEHHISYQVSRTQVRLWDCNENGRSIEHLEDLVLESNLGLDIPKPVTPTTLPPL